MQFELDFFEPGRQVGPVVEGFDVDTPAFCVAFGDVAGVVLGGEVPGLRADYFGQVLVVVGRRERDGTD